MGRRFRPGGLARAERSLALPSRQRGASRPPRSALLGGGGAAGGARGARGARLPPPEENSAGYRRVRELRRGGEIRGQSPVAAGEPGQDRQRRSTSRPGKSDERDPAQLRISRQSSGRDLERRAKPR